MLHNSFTKTVQSCWDTICCWDTTWLALTCSDAQNVQWWIEMCSDERLFVQW